ncbi:MAG: 16S rRNA (guanine(527)-N(7))-methyltransferase RsmG [Candidatus Xenobia bacterium]
MTTREEYVNAIVTENKAYGLTAFKTAAEVDLQLFEDALAFFRPGPRPSGPIVDLGSGAGIPGIPIALADEALEVTLVEARQRKAQFLAREVERLRLRHRVRVVSERAEEMARRPEFRECFAVAVAKAVAPLNILIELAFPLLRNGGVLIAWKGPAVETELQEAANALEVLGGRVLEIQDYKLPGDDTRRVLVYIEKPVPIPVAFPRRPGMAEKRPL